MATRHQLAQQKFQLSSAWMTWHSGAEITFVVYRRKHISTEDTRGMGIVTPERVLGVKVQNFQLEDRCHCSR